MKPLDERYCTAMFLLGMYRGIIADLKGQVCCVGGAVGPSTLASIKEADQLLEKLMRENDEEDS